MINNVGGIDKIMRIVAGVALIALTMAGAVGMWPYCQEFPF